VNSLPKTVTRQHRDCSLNLGPTAPESSTLTTRLPSHPEVVVVLYIGCDQVLTFGPGVSEKTIIVTILDSNVPKPDRGFQIILANPSEGLLLSSPSSGQC